MIIESKKEKKFIVHFNNKCTKNFINILIIFKTIFRPF